MYSTLPQPNTLLCCKSMYKIGTMQDKVHKNFIELHYLTNKRLKCKEKISKCDIYTALLRVGVLVGTTLKDLSVVPE